MTQEQKHPDIASTRPITQLDLDRRPPMAGRSTELDLIRKRLESAKAGGGRVLGFVGPSGIGKTRLLEEAVTSAGVDAALLVCRGSQQAPGYVLRALLRALLRLNPNAPHEVQRRVLQRVLGELGIPEREARLLELLKLNKESEPPPRNPLAAANLILDVLTARSVNGRAALIAVDGIDEVDNETSAILQKVGGHLAKSHTLMLVTARLTPPGWKSVITETLTLEPLTLADISQLAQANGLPPGDGLAKALQQKTEGNPLMVRLALEGFTQGSIPSPQEAIKGQFKAMSSEEGNLLTVLTILGDGTSLAHASRLDLVKTPTPEKAATALIEAGWLTALPPTDRVSFSHAVVRDSLANSMPAELRRKYHQRAGDYYQKASLEGPELFTERAVTHYVKAGAAEAALGALDLALRDAHRRHDREAIITLYRQAITLTVDHDNVSRAARSTYAEKLGDFYAHEHDYKQAAKAYASAPAENAALTVRGKLGLVLLTVDGMRAAHVLTQITSRVPLTYPHDFRWHLETGLTWAHTLEESHYEAVRTCRTALGKLGQMTGYGQAKTLLRTVLGLVLMYQGEQGEARGHLEAARLSWDARGEAEGLKLVELAERSAPRPTITQALLNLCLHPHIERMSP
jgi:tetratricopeptide (TPR) repeat protein